MNTGLQDAYNLGWKLALVANGRAGAMRCSTRTPPSASRWPSGCSPPPTGRSPWSLSDRGLARLLRTRVLARIVAAAMRNETARRFAFRTISQIGIEYRASTLSQALPGLPDEAPRAGDRFPWWPGADLHARLDDTRFNLLLVGQAVPGELPHAEVLHAHRLDESVGAAALRRAGIVAPSFWLLRPDGHVGLCGASFDRDALLGYLAERVRLR